MKKSESLKGPMPGLPHRMFVPLRNACLLGMVAALSGCLDGGSSNGGGDAASKLFYRPQTIALYEAGSENRDTVLHVLNENDSITTCVARKDGTLDKCVMQEAEDADSLLDMVYNPRTRAVHFLQYGDKPLVTCATDRDGRMGDCDVSEGGGAVRGSTSIALNAAGTLAYVVNGDNTLAVCSIPESGALSDCQATDAGGQLSTPNALKLITTADGTHAYILNGEMTNTLTICKLQPGGLPGACREETGQDTFDGLNTIAFHPDGRHLYAANLANDTISICAVSGDMLSDCRATDGGGAFAGIQQIVLDAEGGNAYVVNARNSSIAHCRVASAGASLQDCVPYTIEGFKVTTSMALVGTAASRRAYIASVENSSLYSCRIGPDGRFSDGYCLQLQ